MKRALLLAGLALTLIALAGGVAYAYDLTGSDGPDRIIGTMQGDVIYAEGGRDYVEARGSGDQLHGGPGRDELRGMNGEDEIHGDRGSDVIFGNALPDTIYAADGYTDYVNCGTGRDRAYLDGYDVAINCEDVLGK